MRCNNRSAAFRISVVDASRSRGQQNLEKAPAGFAGLQDVIGKKTAPATTTSSETALLGACRSGETTHINNLLRRRLFLCHLLH